MQRLKNKRLLFLIGLLISLIVLEIFYFHQHNYGTLSLLLWIGSIFTLKIMFFPRNSFLKTIGPTLRTINWFSLFLLWLISLAMIIWALSIPTQLFFHGDEAIISQVAYNTFRESLSNHQWNFLGHQSGTISRFPALWYILQGGIIYLL